MFLVAAAVLCTRRGARTACIVSVDLVEAVAIAVVNTFGIDWIPV